MECDFSMLALLGWTGNILGKYAIIIIAIVARSSTGLVLNIVLIFKTMNFTYLFYVTSKERQKRRMQIYISMK